MLYVRPHGNHKESTYKRTCHIQNIFVTKENSKRWKEGQNSYKTERKQ